MDDVDVKPLYLICFGAATTLVMLVLFLLGRRSLGSELVSGNAAQRLLGPDDVAGCPGVAKRLAVDEQRLGQQLVRQTDRLDGCLHLVLDAVRLIDHVGDGQRLPGPLLGGDDLVEDAEHLVGIDAAYGQIVVGVFAVVEVEAAQDVLVDQPGHDLLDVLPLVMVPRIDKHKRSLARLPGQHGRHAPIGNVGVVEGRFEGLVLDE